MKTKRKFRDTKFGKFLLQKIPKAAAVIADRITDVGLLGEIKGIINTDPDVSPEVRMELTKMLNDFTIEMYRIEAEDRQNARMREVEMAKTGRTDHLMYVSGYVALGAFLSMVATIIYSSVMGIEIENALFHQLMGIIEGVALTVFGYYFGTSKTTDKNGSLSFRASQSRPISA